MQQYRIIAVLLRAIIPIGILGIGLYAYLILMIEPEDGTSVPAAERLIRTKVTKLYAGDYDVVIKTNGVIQPHNEIMLRAEVSGQIKIVNQEFEVGAYFSKGDVLVELDNRDYLTALKVASAQHNVAKASLQLMKDNQERMLNLSQRNAVTQSALDQAEANLAQALAEFEIASAHFEQAERDLDRTKVRAPFDGRVQQKSVGVGQLVDSGTILGDVFAIDYAEVRLPLSGRQLQFLDLPEMEGEMPVEVELRDGIDTSSNTVWKAKIVRTEGILDRNSLELFAIAQVDDPFGLRSKLPVLRIGQPVVAMITGDKLNDVIAIPRDAVRQLNQIFLVDSNELTLKSLTIMPLWSDEEHIIVRDPAINNGVLLATTKLVFAPEGAKVEIIPDTESFETLVTSVEADK
ncbi:MAG: efflux transporter periplasmic adaptor subunit [Blastopirellula sp.]|nr:MAG: efflux transporter periplasmic adaptor subunit [Blastopirellula sp.]